MYLVVLLLYRKERAVKHALTFILDIQFQYDRTMVAAHHIRQDPGIGKFFLQSVRNNKIIDPPSHILLSGAESV